ncbi:MAG: hypothetical protein N3E40_05845, partial [Dehalococcoidia bacterium]|nr:hypothetical protein [Dehalococcoidia bacterium]
QKRESTKQPHQRNYRQSFFHNRTPPPEIPHEDELWLPETGQRNKTKTIEMVVFLDANNRRRQRQSTVRRILAEDHKSAPSLL